MNHQHAVYNLKRFAGDKLSNLFHYAMLLSLSFIFVYPILFLISQSLMQTGDVTDATVQWIPKELSFSNYNYAYEKLHYWQGFMNSAIASLGSAIVQIICCAVAGYGLARYRFYGHSFIMALVLFTFLVPPQTIMVPLFIFFSKLGWINTKLPFIIPAFFGHGLKGAMFVLIFIQFFRGLPSQLEEAARIDGAGAFRTFRQIMLPLARPAIVVVFLFSIVWHWNDTFEPNLYLQENQQYHLTQNLSLMNGSGDKDPNIVNHSNSIIGDPPLNRNRVMAGSLLTILPILILYTFTQRFFVESVERTGIAGD